MTLKKLKVTLNPMYRIFLNFVKSCILSRLAIEPTSHHAKLKFDDIKKFHHVVFES